MPRFVAILVLAPLLAALGSSQVAVAQVSADPMRPDTMRSATAAAPAQFRVNAIIVSDERRIAIVNGKRVGVGDAIGAATVVSISRSEVIVDVNGARQSLRVNSGVDQ